MAWNAEKHRWECDRCGVPISSTKTLCKPCDEYLEKQVKRLREEREHSDIQDKTV